MNSKQTRQNTNLDAVDNAATIMQTCKVSKSSDHANPVRGPCRSHIATIPVQRRCQGQQTFFHLNRIHLCNTNHEILMHNIKFVKDSTLISSDTRRIVDSP
jgi:hypothetical protein